MPAHKPRTVESADNEHVVAVDVVDVVEDVDVARADIALVDVAAPAEVAFPAIFAFPAKLQGKKTSNVEPAARAT